jgi:hypothetical protein
MQTPILPLVTTVVAVLFLCCMWLWLFFFRSPAPTSFFGRRKGRVFALLALVPIAFGFSLLATGGLKRVGYIGFEGVFLLLTWFCVDELRDPEDLFSRWRPLLGIVPSEAAISWLLHGIRVGLTLFLLTDATLFLLFLPRAFLG